MGTLLRLTEPVWGSGRVFVFDSGFCVLQAIVELQKKGLFAAALIKKRRYWPKYIPGNSILAHFTEKGIGESDALQGMLDNVKFHGCCDEGARLCHDVHDNIWNSGSSR